MLVTLVSVVAEFKDMDYQLPTHIAHNADSNKNI